MRNGFQDYIVVKNTFIDLDDAPRMRDMTGCCRDATRKMLKSWKMVENIRKNHHQHPGKYVGWHPFWVVSYNIF